MILRAENLQKTYKDRQVVKNVSLTISSGEVCGLLGPNGAGKTTSFYMVVGFVHADGGKIFIDDTDVTEMPMYERARMGLGYLAQEPTIFRGLTVEENLLAVLERISAGNGRPEDMDKLRQLAQAMQKASLCGLGQSAPNPVVSTLRYFEAEYREHIEQKHCATGKCRSLAVYSINTAACKRCLLCQKNCPVGAISGDREKGFSIDAEKCIKCGRCFEVCKFNAVEKK